ncbi:MAG TPA: helix-turn-helix transcriptional regulator [Ktedonobacteraceae bacterium]|nr:helix-turn-helix transcriptional regulator [Ktedonobacteraceae bacterium]
MIRLKVKEVAAKKGMSMRKLAKNANIAYNTLRTIYRDPYRPLNTVTLDKLATALGVDASELLESVLPENERHDNSTLEG